eukprot:gene17656-9304_t
MVSTAVVISVLAILGTATVVINVLTLMIIYRRRRLRKPKNYPIISFLLAGLIQGIIVVPAYCLKRLDLSNVPEWICDLFRFPYFMCGHMLTLSILLVAMDRMVAINCPFKYHNIISKCRMITCIISFWVAIIIIDLLPFIYGASKDLKCKYVPWRAWSIAVLVLTIVIPFLIISVCYAWIWRLAARHAREISQASLEGHQEAKRGFKTLIELRATRTTLLLVGIFLLCWAPIGIYYLVENICGDCVTNAVSIHMQESFKFWVKVISYTSSIFSPLAYCWRNREFRREASTMRISQFKTNSIPHLFLKPLQKGGAKLNNGMTDWAVTVGPTVSPEKNAESIRDLANHK